MTTYMFPGQGSQVKGMGEGLFELYPSLVQEADEILGYSIESLCLEDKDEQLNNTKYTQPALFVVEALAYLKKSSEGSKPDYCVGHSLGEYSALFAAGVFDFATGLQLVKKRGELMSEVSGGGMLAVINLSEDRISSLLSQNQLESIDIANYNSPKQIILSGLAEDISKASGILSSEAMMCVPLKVSGAFHSRYMKKAAEEFEGFLESFSFKPAHTKVIANVSAEPYTQQNIKSNLSRQIMSPVRWTESIKYLKHEGETEFVEVGPGNILTRLMAQL